jgi:hypothetical protein
MATLAFFESWDGPPLWVPEYRLFQLIVVGIAILCLVLLCILAIRRQLFPLPYILLSLLPLFVALLLSVGLSLQIYLQFYGASGYFGPPVEHRVIFALLLSVIAAPFSVTFLVAFGIVLLIRRPNQSLEPTAGRRDPQI